MRSLLVIAAIFLVAGCSGWQSPLGREPPPRVELEVRRPATALPVHYFNIIHLALPDPPHGRVRYGSPRLNGHFTPPWWDQQALGEGWPEFQGRASRFLELARIFPDTVPVPDGPTAPFRFTFRYPRIDYPFDMTCRRFVAFGDWEPDSGTVPRDLLAVECDVGDQNIAVMYGEADALVELVDSAVARGWVEAIVIESWDMPVITGLFIGRRTSSDGG